MKNTFMAGLILSFGLLISCGSHKPDQVINWNNEIIYHVMPRSFYDSNGDGHGDFRGFAQKLDYLKELGVTTILFTPIYESDFYHNYFPVDYRKIDPEYGTMDEYIYLIKEIHRRDMKFLMDMETQYAQSGNIWFDDSYLNPQSEYSNFIYYRDSLNQYPEQIFTKPYSDLNYFEAWPNQDRNIVFLDLNNDEVKRYMLDFYSFWVDPNQDGVFDDGVDGFRIDHIMDDLDYKGIFTNMYAEFWAPIFSRCKEINPNLFVLGEQSNWNTYGEEMVSKSGADAAFSFPLRFAISGKNGTHDMYSSEEQSILIDPNRVHEEVEKTSIRFDDNTYSVLFLENHDTDRWASIIGEKQGLLRVGAVLNLLLPGVPSIYSGQELGLTGVKGDYGSDANHIPVREAFPWDADMTSVGNAIWYKGDGGWWTNSIWMTGAVDSLNLNYQKAQPFSTWNLYHNLIQLRKNTACIKTGGYRSNMQPTEGVISFTRYLPDVQVSVYLNLTENMQPIQLTNNSGIPVFAEGFNESSSALSAYGILITKYEK